VSTQFTGDAAFAHIVSGTFTGDATAVIGSTQQSWKCYADNQLYDDRGVSWYIQEQVWRIQGAWRPQE
jgi:hypothetical protein